MEFPLPFYSYLLYIEDETTDSSNPLQECQKKLKIKIKELDQTKSLVRHLEDIVSNVQSENTTLKDQLDASRAELDRFRRVNDVLLPAENIPDELEIIAFLFYDASGAPTFGFGAYRPPCQGLAALEFLTDKTDELATKYNIIPLVLYK